ncbi:MAG: hypothetical protein JKY10_11385 [Cohaesibacteraceae bacterium]|nr:hypothetical protein [Cohaesibacteraceae bacterium]
MTNASSSKANRSYCVYAAEWRSIELEVSHMSSWGIGMDHIEIRVEDKTPIPVTSTGYRSLFIPSIETEVTSDPVAYILAWLDHEAAKPEWQIRERQAAQLSLF